MKTNYSFKYRGSLNGQHAFTLTGLDELMAKVDHLERRGGISAMATGIEQHETAERPADDETGVCAADWNGAGHYVVFFDGHADWYDDKIEAMVAFIEYRTETRLS